MSAPARGRHSQRPGRRCGGGKKQTGGRQQAAEAGEELSSGIKPLGRMCQRLPGGTGRGFPRWTARWQSWAEGWMGEQVEGDFRPVRASLAAGQCPPPADPTPPCTTPLHSLAQPTSSKQALAMICCGQLVPGREGLGRDARIAAGAATANVPTSTLAAAAAGAGSGCFRASAATGLRAFGHAGEAGIASWVAWAGRCRGGGWGQEGAHSNGSQAGEAGIASWSACVGRCGGTGVRRQGQGCPHRRQ